MSEQQGDAEFEASLANLDDVGGPRGDADDLLDDADDGAMAPAGGFVTAATARLEAVHGTLSTLGMRIDALVTSTTSYRTALTDRLSEYAEVVTKASRTQAADLEEYRRTAERALGEVRRTISSSEESIVRISSRLDELAGASGGGEAEGRRIVAEVRSILDAQERLSDFLTESLDRFGATVVEQMAATKTDLSAEVARASAFAEQAATRDVLGPVAQELAAVRQTLSGLDLSAQVRAEVDPLRAAIADSSTVEADRELAARVEAIATSLSAVQQSLRELDLSAQVRAEIEPLHAAVSQVASDESGGRLAARLEEVATAVAALLDRVADLDVSGEVRTQVEPLVASVSGAASAGDTARIEARIEDLVNTVTSVREAVTGSDRSDELREQIEGLQATIQAVAGQESTDVGARLDRLSADLDARILDALAESAARTDTADLGARLDRLSADLNARILDALAESAARTDSGDLGARIDRVAEDLRAQVTAALAESATRSDASDLGARIDGIRATIEAAANSEASDLGSRIDGLHASIEAASRTDAPDLGARIDALSADLQARVLDALGDVGTPIASLREELQDVASGEVVGALWDEVRGVRMALDGLTSGDEEPDAGRADELQSLRASIAAVETEIASLAEEIRVGRDSDDPLAGAVAEWSTASIETGTAVQAVRTSVDGLSGRVDDALDAVEAVASDLATLRSDLAEGLEVVPATSVTEAIDAVRDGLDQLRVDVDGIGGRIGALQTADADGLAERDDALVAQLSSLRTAINEVHARLDEGLVLSEDPDAPASGAELVDQVAALRDQITAELSSVSSGGGGVDADAIDLLRSEIRDAGGVADDVVDALREELKALRRRVAVRSHDLVLDDDAVARIADAVADRLVIED